MNPVQRYFKACDLLDKLQHTGAKADRIRRVSSWVQDLMEEAREALHNEVNAPKTCILFGGIVAQFGTKAA